MSTSDNPPIVRTTGLARSERPGASDASDGEGTEPAVVGHAVARRERELAAVRRQLREREAALEEMTEWAAFLDRELRAQRDRIRELEAERERQARQHERVVERYEALLAEARAEETDADESGLFARLRRLF